MNTRCRTPLALVGRILLGLIFVLSGFGKIAGFDGTVGYIAVEGPADAARSLAALTIVRRARRRPAAGRRLLHAAGRRSRSPASRCSPAFLFHTFWAVPAAQADGRSRSAS